MTEGLILKRANVSRPSGQWSDDDYDVLWDGKPVGRIYKDSAVANDEVRWFWSIFASRPGPLSPVRIDGRAPTLDEAKTQFRASWEAFKDDG